MGFLQTIFHLLPRAWAWRVTKRKNLRRLLEGIAPSFDDARTAIDATWEEISPETTTNLDEWERQYGLEANANEATRRLNLAAEWRATGGQSPGYVQGVLQTAGFDVYIHEWWSGGPPYVARNPHDYTDAPLIGTVQCTPDAFRFNGQPQCSDGQPDSNNELIPQYQCNAFLVNDPHYLVNKLLTQAAPPPIPNNPAVYPKFFYVGAATFPSHATIPASRRGEFERLLLKLRPLHLWIVTLIDYDTTPPPGAFSWDTPGSGWDESVWDPP
jgi:hypothetical protein